MYGKRKLFTRLLLLGVVFTLSLVPLAGAQPATRLLRMSVAPPTRIDPAIGTDFASTTSHVNLYDALVWPTSKGEIVPHVAERWRASPDGLTWTFELRRGVKFHRGFGELTAEDVVFSFNRLMAIGEGFSYLYKGRVKSVKAIGKYTVQFSLAKPFGPFLSTLLRLAVVSKACVQANKKPGQYGEFGDYARDWLTTNDCGSGPYVMKKRVVGESLTMERFKDYWLTFPPNAPDEFTFIETTEPVTIRTLMAKRELEISDQWQSLEAYRALDAIEGVDIARIPDGSVLYLMLHNRKPPTDDVQFRRALSWAMNYKTVTEDIFPGTLQARGPVAGVIPGHNPKVFQYTFDLEKAREELKKSKYAGRLGELSLDYCWTAEVPDLEKIALMFQADLAKLGIRVNVVKLPWLKMIEVASKPETTCHLMSIWVAPHYPEAGSTLESKYHSRSTGTWEQTEWLQNPEVDRLIDEALATVDRTARFKKYADLQARLVDLSPSIFLFDQVARHAYQATYVRWPQAKDPNPVMGYNMAARFIEVFPEKKPR